MSAYAQQVQGRTSYFRYHGSLVESPPEPAAMNFLVSKPVMFLGAIAGSAGRDCQHTQLTASLRKRLMSGLVPLTCAATLRSLELHRSSEVVAADGVDVGETSGSWPGTRHQPPAAPGWHLDP